MFKSLFKTKDDMAAEIGKLEDLNTIYADALDHIARVARNSRTQSKRDLWISARATQALQGLPYDKDTLPKYPTMCNKKK